MKIGFDNSYLFPAGNKNGLVRNEPDAIWTKDCTAMVRFKPDNDKFIEELGDEWRKAGCVVGKNGKHIGIFYAVGKSGEEVRHFIEFEYWCFNEEKGDDDIKAMVFDVTDIKDSEYFDVVIKRRGNKFIFRLNGEEKEEVVEKLTDYSYSFLWIGAATRVNPDHNEVFYGDIHKMHIQYGLTPERDIELFFNNYEEFNDKTKSLTNKDNIFTSDFKNITQYKILDQSLNGNHPIRYSKEWLD